MNNAQRAWFCLGYIAGAFAGSFWDLQWHEAMISAASGAAVVMVLMWKGKEKGPVA